MAVGLRAAAEDGHHSAALRLKREAAEAKRNGDEQVRTKLLLSSAIAFINAANIARNDRTTEEKLNRGYTSEYALASAEQIARELGDIRLIVKILENESRLYLDAGQKVMARIIERELKRIGVQEGGAKPHLTAMRRPGR